MFGCLIGGSGKTRIAQTSATAFQPDDFLAVFHYFSFNQSRNLISGDRTKRNININILSKSSAGIIAASGFTIFSQYVLIIPEREQGPGIFISPKNYMTATTAVATIRA